MATTATAALSPGERLARGRAVREAVARDDHAHWEPWAERPDPVALLEQQAAGRPAELVPIRYGRMLSSPFAFFREAVAIMAFDLAGTPSTGFEVQLCGDAHVANFGAFASPERLVFGLEDFDETLPGPWEWDVKRLAASVEVAARERGLEAAERHTAVLATARGYRTAMLELAASTNLQAWYARLDDAAIAALGGADDRLRPPSVPPDDEAVDDAIRALLLRYRHSLKSDRRRLLESYRYVHAAGCGVGVRAWIVLLRGRDQEDRVVLQVKEAEASVLERYAGMSRQTHHGQRVVEGQWLMQSADDVLLGWLRTTGIDAPPRDFYVRQRWARTASADAAAMRLETLAAFGRLCGWTLARAHARSGDRLAIAGYLGDDAAFDEALAAFAAAYADQNERDHAALAAAVRSGRVSVA